VGMGVEVAMEVVAEVEVEVETYCGLAPGPRARRKRGSRCRNSPSTPRATARMRPSRDWSTMLPRTASPADCSRVRVARRGPSGSGSSWTYSWMPTGKPARSRREAGRRRAERGRHVGPDRGEPDVAGNACRLAVHRGGEADGKLRLRTGVAAHRDGQLRGIRDADRLLELEVAYEDGRPRAA